MENIYVKKSESMTRQPKCKKIGIMMSLILVSSHGLFVVRLLGQHTDLLQIVVNVGNRI